MEGKNGFELVALTTGGEPNVASKSTDESSTDPSPSNESMPGNGGSGGPSTKSTDDSPSQPSSLEDHRENASGASGNVSESNSSGKGEGREEPAGDLQREVPVPAIVQVIDVEDPDEVEPPDNDQVVVSVPLPEVPLWTRAFECLTCRNVDPKRVWRFLLIAASCFFATINFTSLAPFFPAEAKIRGCTWEIGFIFGIFQLGYLIVCLYLLFHVQRHGERLVFAGAMTLMSISTALFGTTYLVETTLAFVSGTMGVRFLQGVAAGAVSFTMYTIIAREYPFNTASLLGVVQAVTGAAFTAGPVFGSTLYFFGGYFVPFAVSSALNSVLTVLCYKYLPADVPNNDEKRWRQIFVLLKQKLTLLSLLCILCTTITMTFFESTISVHLTTLKMETWHIGLLMSLVSFFYVITTPAVGRVIQKMEKAPITMALGCLGTGLGALLLGPAPFFGAENSLYNTIPAFVCLGIGIGMQINPPFIVMQNIGRKLGFLQNTQTDAMMAGVINVASPTGSMIGPALGSFTIALIGFAWSNTILACLNFVACALLFVYILTLKAPEPRPPMDPAEIEPLQRDVLDPES